MRAGQFMPFLMIGAFRNGPLSAGAIFALERKKTEVIRKNKMVSITLRLRKIRERNR